MCEFQYESCRRVIHQVQNLSNGCPVPLRGTGRYKFQFRATGNERTLTWLDYSIAKFIWILRLCGFRARWTAGGGTFARSGWRWRLLGTRKMRSDGGMKTMR